MWRRRVPIALAAVAAVALLAAAWWFLWVPRWRPPLEAGERYGIDVSAHQGTIDWGRVAGDGIRSAYVKATEGGDLTDDLFLENWTGAARAGIERGANHFLVDLNPASPQQPR